MAARSCEVESARSHSIAATIKQALSPWGLAVVGAMLYLAADRNAVDCVQIAAGIFLESHASAFATARDRIRNATHTHTHTHTYTHTHIQINIHIHIHIHYVLCNVSESVSEAKDD